MRLYPEDGRHIAAMLGAVTLTTDPYRGSTECPDSFPWRSCDNFSYNRTAHMTTHQFHEFSEDEQADAESIFASHGFDIIDFDIRDEDRHPARDSASLICRQVMVTRRSNDKSYVYDAGQGTAWHADFERDLAAGLFGASSV
jgi:hypothetical protein